MHRRTILLHKLQLQTKTCTLTAIKIKSQNMLVTNIIQVSLVASKKK